MGEHVAQVGFGIDVVELRGTDERVDRRGPFAAAVSAGGEIVLAAERDRTQCPFRGIVIDVYKTVVAVPRERFSARERIVGRTGQVGLFG